MYLTACVLLLCVFLPIVTGRSCTIISTGQLCQKKCCGTTSSLYCTDICTGHKCYTNLDCDGECCVGTDLLNKRCGVCSKTRHCTFISTGNICLLRCCGNSSLLVCNRTCDGILCTSDNDCDGECCSLDKNSTKTCGPCTTTRRPYTRETTRTAAPEITTMAVETTRLQSQITTQNWPTHCTYYNCATNCCRNGQCVDWKYCLPSRKPPAKKSSKGKSNKKVFIPIGLACAVLLIVIVTMITYAYIKRRTREVPHPVHSSTAQVAYHNDGYGVNLNSGHGACY